jgi:hypothetical protein
LLALAAVITLSAAGQDSRLNKLVFKIAAGMAPEALAEFVRQSGYQVLFDFDAVRNFSTHAVSGQLDAGEALSRMFAGSGLTFEFINDRTIAVHPRPLATTPVGQAPQQAWAPAAPGSRPTG